MGILIGLLLVVSMSALAALWRLHRKLRVLDRQYQTRLRAAEMQLGGLRVILGLTGADPDTRRRQMHQLSEGGFLP